MSVVKLTRQDLIAIRLARQTGADNEQIRYHTSAAVTDEVLDALTLEKVEDLLEKFPSNFVIVPYKKKRSK